MLMLSLARCGDWASTCDYDINIVYRNKKRTAEETAAYERRAEEEDRKYSKWVEETGDTYGSQLAMQVAEGAMGEACASE